MFLQKLKIEIFAETKKYMSNIFTGNTICLGRIYLLM